MAVQPVVMDVLDELRMDDANARRFPEKVLLDKGEYFAKNVFCVQRDRIHQKDGPAIGLFRSERGRPHHTHESLAHAERTRGAVGNRLGGGW